MIVIIHNKIQFVMIRNQKESTERDAVVSLIRDRSLFQKQEKKRTSVVNLTRHRRVKPYCFLVKSMIHLPKSRKNSHEPAMEKREKIEK
jgi:hypothetical protein